MDKVGYIGLGSMGAPIARRLARSGFAVTGCDVSPQALEAFDEPGTRRESDPVAAAAGAEFVGVCVLTDAQVESVLRDGRMFDAMAEGGVVILNSTVSPALARRLAGEAEAKGRGLIDVGVSGGAPAAIEGTLSLFVGGHPAVVERARPVLEAIGKVAHLGPVGRGLEGKLLNNLISIANYGMSAAILDVGDQLGFDRAQLREALMAGSAQSFALRVVPGLLQPRGTAGATSSHAGMHDLLKKDVDHARELPAHAEPGMAALLASAEHMLQRIRRAGEEGR